MQVKTDSFFPMPEDFGEYVGVPLDKFRGPRKVLVSLDVLRLLIGLVAAGTGFDEEFYLERHADLRAARDADQLADPRMHYAKEGYFEQRPGSRGQAYPVDEKWYLAEYPDVAVAVAAGNVDSATAHYLATGRKEGRLPSSQLTREIRELISLLKATG